MKLNKSALRSMFLLLLSALIIISITISSCHQSGNSTIQYTGNVVKDGGMLAKQYCTSCHQMVPPSALTKDVWQYHIMPDMAKYLHLGSYMGGYFKPDTAAAGISLDDYNRIVSYYTTLAPDKLPKAKPPVPLQNDWAGFTLKTSAAVDSVPYTTTVAVNPYSHIIYSSDLATRCLYEWNTHLKSRVVADLPTAASNVLFPQPGNKAVVLSIGLIELADFPNGRLTQVDLNSKVQVEPQTVATDLPRPVQTIEADLNKDGMMDYVVCGQGNKKGGLYWLRQNKAHTYDKVEISTMAGATEAIAGDFNNDGWPDIMALFGTNNEGLYLFTNNHNGGFNVRQLLKVPPVYGSTSFKLADMNNDGKPDLIYTCGYNFRDSRILKPYHGLYIFTNQGNWKFKQEYFYPINGCTKAVVADFDGDGDLDIATIAFFADMQSNPAEEFIYFEQDKTLSFKPHAVPVSKYGRWMSMDVSDLNGDGKPDVVLGNYARGFVFQPGYKPNWSEKYPLIILENHMQSAPKN